MDLSYILTSTSGRIPRSQWWAGVLILVVISLVINLILIYALGIMFTTGGRIITLIVQLALAYPFYAVSAKRFEDRDKPGNLAWIFVGVSILSSLLTLIGAMGNPRQPGVLDWIFGVASLIVAVWYIVELGILRGTVGSNTYGPDPLAGTA
jgi:uncharacterized membrane protein YhaH (DUF805 family)